MEPTTHRLIITFSFLVITTFLLQSVTAQTTRPDRTQPTQYAAFKPSVSAIIVVLITILFFLAFFSVYVRHCSDTVVTPVAGALSRGNDTRGLDASLIETWPIFVYSEVKGLKIGKGALECAVCLNEFEDDESLRLLPMCDHVFHPECIDEWLSSHTTCPVCRANLADTNVEESQETTPVSDSVTGGSDDRGGVAIEEAEETVADDGGSVANREMIWSKFPRSHSTGHSLVQPGVNIDRFTLKLPDQIRNEIMTRALNRTTSLVVQRRGYGATGGGEGKSYRRLGSLDRPDRWKFTMAPPFVALESSMKKSNRSGSGSEGSGTSKRFNLIGRLSFNRFGGSKRSEPELIVKGSNSNESLSPV